MDLTYTDMKQTEYSCLAKSLIGSDIRVCKPCEILPPLLTRQPTQESQSTVDEHVLVALSPLEVETLMEKYEGCKQQLASFHPQCMERQQEGV